MSRSRRSYGQRSPPTRPVRSPTCGDAGLQFINADYTLCLSRLPLSDAIGLESAAHTSEDGVAVGHCTLHDTAGPIGYCMTTAVANPRAGT